MTDTTTPKPFAWIGHTMSTGESVLIYDSTTMPAICRVEDGDLSLLFDIDGVEPLVTRGDSTYTRGMPTPDAHDPDHVDFAAAIVRSTWPRLRHETTTTVELQRRANEIRREAATNALVEQVARAMMEAGNRHHGDIHWDGIDEGSREQWRDTAREIITKFDVSPKAGA